MFQNPIIKKGYKQTEISVIPEDWYINNLGGISDKIIGGGTPSRSNPIYWGNEIPWVTVKDFATFNPFKSQEYITRVGLKNSSSHLIPKGVIITSTRMALGKAVIYEVDVSINQDLKAIFLKRNFDTNFVYYWFQFHAKYIEDLGSGSTVMGLSVGDLRNIKVLLPESKSEQSAIASILSDTDALIENLDTLIEKKKAIKQGAMQELLTGKRRLAGFNGEWTGKKIGDIFILSASYSKTEFIEKDGRYLIMDMGSVSQEGKNISSKRTSLKSDCLVIGDLVMPKDDIGGGNIIGKTVYIEKNDKYILGDHVYKLSSKNININPIFFSYLINSNKINRELRKKVAGSAQLGLGRKSVENQELKFPFNKGEQDAIAKIIIDLDSEIESLEYQRTKYKTIKQGMMQQLLTGNIRVYGHN